MFTWRNIEPNFYDGNDKYYAYHAERKVKQSGKVNFYFRYISFVENQIFYNSMWSERLVYIFFDPQKGLYETFYE